MNRFDTFNHFTEARSYTRSLTTERELTLDGHTYLCSWEVLIRFWDDDRYPELANVFKCEAFDAGSHQVRDTVILGRLDALAELYTKDNLTEMAEQAMKEGE